ncbi:MAG: GNAT family N-acetyltransferase [Candidatus Daviesbacteria bacterium]|nr:GNAT family N-acetyltransferase [Candidatus Daviesbacteria bacterium]
MATEKDDVNIVKETSPHSKPLIEITSSDGELILKQFSPSDTQEIFELIDRNREHLSQNEEDTSDKYPTLESVEISILQPSNPDRLRFGIRDAQGTLLGSINLTPEKDNPHKGEIGYYLGKEATGKGYTTKAVNLLTDYAFNHLGYQELYGIVANTNKPSQEVLRRAGYKETGKEVLLFSKTISS